MVLYYIIHAVLLLQREIHILRTIPTTKFILFV